MPTLTNSDSSVLEKLSKEYLTEHAKQEIQSAVLAIVEDEFNNLCEHASESMNQLALEKAEALLRAVLAGDDNAAKNLFDLSDSTRYNNAGFHKPKPWASLIAGTLFETDAIELRRELVEAHADLLKNERIKDLESIVEGLTNQIEGLEELIRGSGLHT